MFYLNKIYLLLTIMCYVAISIQETCPGQLITSLHQKNCTDLATSETAYYLNRTECIPKCSVYPTEVQTGDCSVDPNACTAGYNCESRCGPLSALQEYSCQTDADCYEYNKRAKCGKYCVLPTLDDGAEAVTCMAYHSNIPAYVSKWWTAQKFKPICDDDGNWEPKQCRGGLQGRCLCFGSTGVRLFGEALYKKAANMTCACSRKKSELESSGRNYVSLHCDSQGNYEKLQCDVEKGICWCAEEMTGDVAAAFVPIGAMKKLPCYAESEIGSQYLRQCESKKFATAMIVAKLKKRGVISVQTDTLLCNADGSYGAYSITSGIAYCTWRDNSKIGTWQANLAGMTDKLTCNCARDYYMYQHTQNCDGNGNYVTLQQIVNDNNEKEYYCVDENGFAKTGMLSDPLTDCSLFY